MKIKLKEKESLYLAQIVVGEVRRDWKLTERAKNEIEIERLLCSEKDLSEDGGKQGHKAKLGEEGGGSQKYQAVYTMMKQRDDET
ncbi:hypothetical protein TSUD_301860 [Trifolium subterraneum]|uniref:Uncharacterized protein n=1 Tax=Trifolium subterraneum TaxID=3900 RepID=A0A2Z6PU63_TRISU|nr:hypothetical protein TSUD_301860 [Trifolium subterraneum]